MLQNGIDEKVFKEYPLDILMNTVLSAMRWIHYSNTEYSKVERSTVQSTVKNIVMSGIKY